MRNFLYLLRPSTILLAGLLLATCTQDSHNAASSTFASSPGSPEATSIDYLIGPRDLLQVTVFQVPDLTRTVQVSGNGFVNLPLIGNVKVGGKTIDQAQQEIAAKLGKTYLRSPQVSISLAKSGQRVTVTRMNVAGMTVRPGEVLVFCVSNRCTSSAWRSADRPSASAAANAFIVGP